MLKRPRKYHEQQVEYLVSLYEPGMTMEELSRRAYLARTTISTCYRDDLAERGIVFGGRGYKRKNKGKERE